MAVVTLGIAVVAILFVTAAPSETRPNAVARHSAEPAALVGAEAKSEHIAPIVARSMERAVLMPLAPLQQLPSYAALPDMHAVGAAGDGSDEPVYEAPADNDRDDDTGGYNDPDDEHGAIIDSAALDPSFDPADREGGPEDIFIR